MIIGVDNGQWACPGGRAMSPQAEQIRAELCRRFPQEFEHGYRTGYLGEPRPPCVYPEDFHTWPLVRKNSWYAGWNLGNVQRQADHG
jgi:hypothetical protein